MSRVCHKDLKRESLALLAQINVLDQNNFQRRLAKIFREDDIWGGALAVAHILKQMRKIAPRGEAGFWDLQIEQCVRVARISAKIRQGWQQFGLPTVYDVLAYQPLKQLPRYHSLPNLRND